MDIRPFLLERYFGEHELTTRYQLSASDCEPQTPREVLRLCGAPEDDLLDLRLAYTETRGHPELRAEIARFYPECTDDDVLVCNAPQEAIFLAMHAMLRPGDRVVVTTPCYQSLQEVAHSIDCEVAVCPVSENDSGWHFDLDRLDELLTEDTRLLVTNAPHNPTGALPTPQEWARIAELVTARGVRWFSDEMYRGLEREPDDALTPAASLVDGALSLWGMSKTFGLAGLRIGWLACRDGKLLAEIEKLKDYTSICSNALGEVLATRALAAGERIIADNRGRIAGNAARMAAFVDAHRQQLAWQAPTAGPVSLARLRQGSATEHAERVRNAGALLVPGPLFELEDCYLRIGLGRADFGDALAAWATVLRP